MYFCEDGKAKNNKMKVEQTRGNAGGIFQRARKTSRTPVERLNFDGCLALSSSRPGGQRVEFREEVWIHRSTQS